ncbi:MAG: sugar phosphate isomerase/epimerase [Clostridia bacterium]|nr:sugar phosphate isomerase/epimerase [Clostridia bacterium]
MIKIGTYMIKDALLSPEERLRMVKEVGFDFVCFSMGSMLAGETVGFTPSLCEKVGIAFDNVHLTGKGTHAMWAEGSEGDAIADRYCNEIALCSDYGVKTGIMHVTWGVRLPPLVGEVGLRRFERVAACAEKHGFTLALENSVSDTNLCYVLDRIQSPYVGFCFDSGHHSAFAPDADFLGKYGNRLVATHLQDNNGREDLHLMPLDGCIDWKRIASQLAQSPFAREQICGEVSGIVVRESDKTAAEIAESLSCISALKQGLVTVEEGCFSVYKGFSYEELLERLYRNLRTVASYMESSLES